MVAKFRKKATAVVEAEQWFPGKVVPGVCNDRPADPRKVGKLCECVLLGGPAEPHVHTAHGAQAVLLEPGDWVIPEPGGKGYCPVKPDIFAATYEPAD